MLGSSFETGLDASLGNTTPTGAILVVLVTMLGPISGAHFNPAVTAVFMLRREIEAKEAGAFVIAQVIAGLEILPYPDIGPFRKEDGEIVVEPPGKSAR